jgi:hypothetical protein
MIQKILIADSSGYPFFSRSFDDELPEVDPALLSGLISSIGAMGNELFKKKIAQINFGSEGNGSFIYIVSKEILFENKSIYFVFFMQGECNDKIAKQLSTQIFIENKAILKNPDRRFTEISEKVNTIIDNLLSKQKGN